MKIEITQSASSDLGNILDYYREQGVPEKGRQLASEILKKTERLAAFPDSGRIVPEFEMGFLREIIVPPFRVVYRRDPHKVWLIRIWRSERLLSLE
ncbi:MAG TPA: type II toxin-antitoxin system RelE/ParE family toxin [bacterium]|nr:type II toxin-antitoxin system RelE/ParE family toxin [bacterium]